MVKRCCAESCFNSQTTNRNISYFGFPKYLEFAQKWAIAANRPDLLEKKLESITKYFLCAEHFTDDCFMDPPNNTKLKKTIYPISIPIPTKFESNFNKYVPQAKSIEYTNLNNQKISKLVKVKCVNQSDLRSGGVSLLNKSTRIVANESPTKENHEIDVLNVEDDQFDNQVESFAENSKFIVPDNFDFIIEEECLDTELRNENDQIFYTINSTCRLCANCFYSQNDLVNIFSDIQLTENVNRLMPNSIQQDDGLPQSICNSCINNVNSCIETLDSFMIAQDQIRAAFSA